MSFWMKPATTGVWYGIYGAWGASTASDITKIEVYSDNTLNFIDYQSGALTAYLYTTQVFRDLSAWYHIVVAVDTTQATASNRIKIYVNGSQVTSFGTATYPTQNLDMNINSSSFTNRLGLTYNTGGTSAYYMSGYLSEYYSIDGQQLDATSFGQTDTDTGIWIPKSYGGSYGTNGFYLKFANSSSLGTDSSGNGNNFTVNNLTSVDQTTDTPTNNFCTWNPLYYYGNQTITEGNLKLATGTSGASVGTIAVNTGKWYWEQKCISINAESRIMGISKLVAGESLYDTAVYYKSDGQKIINNTNSSYGATLANNDIVGLAIDVGSRSVTFYKNGTSQGSIDISSVYSSGDYIIPALPQSGGASQTVDVNFGAGTTYSANGYTDGAGYGNFSYSVPSGYYSLCTRNLANFG